MIPVVVERDRAARFLRAIAEGLAIEAPDEGWSGHDLVALAGACHFAAFSHGPQNWVTTQDLDLEALHPERREAMEATFTADLGAAIEWHSHVTGLVADEEYAHQFEDEHAALTGFDAEGDRVLHPLRGFKAFPNRL